MATWGQSDFYGMKIDKTFTEKQTLTDKTFTEVFHSKNLFLFSWKYFEDSEEIFFGMKSVLEQSSTTESLARWYLHRLFFKNFIGVKVHRDEVQIQNN